MSKTTTKLDYMKTIVIAFILACLGNNIGAQDSSVPNWILSPNERWTIINNVGCGFQFGNHNRRIYLFTNSEIYNTQIGSNTGTIAFRIGAQLKNYIYINSRLFNNSFKLFETNDESYTILNSLEFSGLFVLNNRNYNHSNYSQIWIHNNGLRPRLGLKNTIHTDALRKLSNVQMIIGFGIADIRGNFELGFDFLNDKVLPSLFGKISNLGHDHGETTTWNIYSSIRINGNSMHNSQLIKVYTETKMITDRRTRLKIFRPHPLHRNGLYETVGTGRPEHGYKQYNLFHHYRTINIAFESIHHHFAISAGWDRPNSGARLQRWGHQGQVQWRKSIRDSIRGQDKSPSVESPLFPWQAILAGRYYSKPQFVWDLLYEVKTVTVN